MFSCGERIGARAIRQGRWLKVAARGCGTTFQSVILSIRNWYQARADGAASPFMERALVAAAACLIGEEAQRIREPLGLRAMAPSRRLRPVHDRFTTDVAPLPCATISS